MSQLLLDELFDEEDDGPTAADGSSSTSQPALENPVQSTSTNQLTLAEEQKSQPNNAEIPDEIPHHSTSSSSPFLYNSVSTPSLLSESNTSSTTLLCRTGEKRAAHQHHFSEEQLPALKKQASAGSADTTITTADRPAAASCSVYYDALEEQLRESGNTAVEEKTNTSGYLVNPVFNSEEGAEEGGELIKSDQHKNKGVKAKSEELFPEDDDDDDEDDGRPIGQATCSRENLIKLKPTKAKEQSAAKKQPHPPASVSLRKPREHRLRAARRSSSEMRLLGTGASGTAAYAATPQQMNIADGPIDPSSSSTAAIGGKRTIQAKQNQMYLITTLLPGHSTQQQNGNSRHQQQNGHRRNQSASAQQQQMIPAALINRMLPTELILRVFSYLDITSLCRCAQVCRCWNKLAMDGSNWMDVDLFSFQREVKFSVVESLAKRCGTFLKELSLKGCENVQDNAMRSFAAKCPNIERLTLAKCKLVTDATCEYIGRYCHKIVMVDLENCTLITDIAMKFIGEGCKRLEELNVSWCEQITDLGIAYIAKSCPSLRTLFCKGLENLSSQCFGPLRMPELRTLSLLACPNVIDETVADIARNCHCLEFLSLSNCKEITDQALVSISHGCPRLRDIELAGCTNLTDTGFIHLSKNCHEIERMDLEECLLITDSTLSNLNNGCPNLFSLSLSHCENLTDNGLAELCVAHKDRLQVLELDNCPNITDQSLESMKMLKLLERVDLYDCQMITKDAIKKFKQARPEVDVHAYFAPATPPPQTPPVRRGICRCCAIL